MAAANCWARLVGADAFIPSPSPPLPPPPRPSLLGYPGRLSEAPCGQVRMSTLAEQVGSSKSRISHQIGRMEKAGLARRQECPGDRRGVFAVLTDQGLEVLRSAAPTHLRGVRDNLIDLLS